MASTNIVANHVIGLCLYIAVAGFFANFLAYETAYESSKTASSVALGCAVVFSWSCFSQLKRIWLLYSGNFPSSILVLMVTSFISGITLISYVITLLYPSYFSKDALGVFFHHAIYQQWLLTVPLLGYATVLPDNIYLDKRNDVALVVSLFLMISFGFFLQYDDISMPVAKLCFALSWLWWGFSYYFLYKSYAKDNMLIYGQHDLQETKNARMQLKRDLSIVLALLLPAYHFLYLLAVWNVLNGQQFFMAWSCFEIVTKGFFVQTVLDSQLTLITINSKYSILAQESHKRQIFIKFLLHEIAGPLKTILQCTKIMHSTLYSKSVNCSNDNDERIHDIKKEKDVIIELQQAVQIIDDNLHNFRIFSMIEDKSYHLNKKKFHLHDMIEKVVKNVTERNPKLMLLNKIEDDVMNNEYLGDWNSVQPFIEYIILHLHKRHGRATKIVGLGQRSKSLSRIEITHEEGISDMQTISAQQDVITLEVYQHIDHLSPPIVFRIFNTILSESPNRTSEIPKIKPTHSFSQQNSRRNMIIDGTKTNKIVFQISCEGDSFTKEEMEDMFEPYSKLQRDGPNIDKSYYSSLKLAIGKEIVLLHGGSVVISPKSRNGVRNVIYITVPFQEAPAENVPTLNAIEITRSGTSDSPVENPIHPPRQSLKCIYIYHLLALLLYGIGSGLFGYYLTYRNRDLLLSHRASIVASGGTIAFVVLCIVQVKRLPPLYSLKLVLPIHVFYVIIMVTTVTMVSYMITVLCPSYFHKDAFGVIMHHARYQDWLICVPLMGYVAVVPENIYLEELDDFGLVISLFLMIAFGFVLHYENISMSIAILCFMLSCCCGILSYYYLYKTLNSTTYLIQYHSQDGRQARLQLKRELCIELGLMLPGLPILYILFACNKMDINLFFITSTIFEIVMIGFFAQTVLDSQLTLVTIHTKSSTLAQVTKKKYIFLKYLLHEIGVPLNAISMSAECIRNTLEMLTSDYSQDILALIDFVSEIDEASLIIDDNLRHCQMFATLEDKTFQLNKVKFRFRDMIKEINRTSKAQSKMLLLISSFDDSIMFNDYIGDWYSISLFVVYVILHMEKRNAAAKIDTASNAQTSSQKRFIPGNGNFGGFNQSSNSATSSVNMESNWYSAINLDIRKRCIFADDMEKQSEGSFTNSQRLIFWRARGFARSATQQRVDHKNVSQDNEEDSIIFQISCEGDSFTKEEMEDMFEPYSKLQGDGPHVDKSYYSSLKLAIGKEIVLLHGGSVVISPKSRNGIRNVIYITVPFGRYQRGAQSELNRLKIPPSLKESSNNLGDDKGDRVERYNSWCEDNAIDDDGNNLGITLSNSLDKEELQMGRYHRSSSVLSHYSHNKAVSPSNRNRISQSQEGSLTSVKHAKNVSYSDVTECTNNSDNTRNQSNINTVNNKNISKSSRSHLIEEFLIEMKVLVVDDTASNRKMLRKILDIYTVQSHLACDGKQAVDMVQKQVGYYDLIFMDFTMPVMNGDDATRAIRKLGFDNSIIGVTANMMKEDFDIFYSAGADLVISKPLKRDMIKNILDCFDIMPNEGKTEIKKKICSLRSR